MMENKDIITVTVRSFIPPQESVKGYELGRPFKIEMPRGITLEGLAQRILSKNINQLGIMAVNGEVSQKNLVLAPGDKIDLYALLDGG